MTDYFSDRQFGSNPRIEEKIGQGAWAGILSLIQIRIDDGSLAYGFPSHCPDGNAIDGKNVSAFAARVRAEIHDLARRRALLFVGAAAGFLAIHPGDSGFHRVHRAQYR